MSGRSSGIVYEQFFFLFPSNIRTISEIDLIINKTFHAANIVQYPKLFPFIEIYRKYCSKVLFKVLCVTFAILLYHYFFNTISYFCIMYRHVTFTYVIIISKWSSARGLSSNSNAGVKIPRRTLARPTTICRKSIFFNCRSVLWDDTRGTTRFPRVLVSTRHS